MCGEGYLTLARLAARRGDALEAGRLLAQGIDQCPDDPRPLRESALWLWHHATPAETAAALTELIRLDPGDAEARFNLALTGLKLGRVAEAVTALREALRVQPRYAAARSLLAAVNNSLAEGNQAA